MKSLWTNAINYDRSRVLHEINNYVGAVAQLKCNGAIKRRKCKDGEAPYKLFLPIFDSVRTDKGADQANTFDEIFGNAKVTLAGTIEIIGEVA